VTILSTFSADVKAHVLGLFLAVLLIGGSVYGVESLIAKHDAATEQRYELLLQKQEATTKADEASFQQTLTTLNAQNAQLTASIAQRDAALATILKQDANLNVQQAAAKLGGTATPDNTVDLPLDTSRNIAAELDTLTTVKANLASETTVATNLQTELTAQTKVVTDLNAQLVDQTNSCNATIKTLKAQARKSKLKWFGIGFVAGYVAGHFPL
jgi:hypothetical protein